jgi:hypothetical protein
MTTNENEVILIVAGGDKLTFFSEVRNKKMRLSIKLETSFLLSRKMNDYYKI